MKYSLTITIVCQMPWKMTPYRPSVPMPYRWSTVISHLQVTRGQQKTVWRHRWTAVLIKPCSTLRKEIAPRKHFQVKHCEIKSSDFFQFFPEILLIMIITFKFFLFSPGYLGIGMVTCETLFLLLLRWRHLHLHLLKDC